MKTLRYIGKCTLIRTANSKMLFFFMVLLFTVMDFGHPYLLYLQEQNYPISWCIFPFLLTSHAFLSVFYLGVVYTFSDVPFMQHFNLYQIVRTGRNRWAMGQIGGIFLKAALITVGTVLISLFPFLGRLEWTTGWGKMIYTLASQRVLYSDFYAGRTVSFRFFYEILDIFSPLQLIGLTVAICTLICTFLGLLMFLISLYGGRVPAVSCGFAVALMVYFVENLFPQNKQSIAHFVPTYWAEVALTATPSSGYYRLPSLTYMFSFLILFNMVMSALICLRIRHIQFDWENEDA